jgi:hypothetical protein
MTAIRYHDHPAPLRERAERHIHDLCPALAIVLRTGHLSAWLTLPLHERDAILGYLRSSPWPMHVAAAERVDAAEAAEPTREETPDPLDEGREIVRHRARSRYDGLRRRILAALPWRGSIADLARHLDAPERTVSQLVSVMTELEEIETARGRSGVVERISTGVRNSV